MPISAQSLFGHLGLTISGTVRWGQRPMEMGPGVYAITLGADPAVNSGLLTAAPISLPLVAAWIARVPSFALNGMVGPASTDVAACLQRFWLPDEGILYVGKATSLCQRLSQFFGHTLGDSRPHAGGHWLKTLENLNDLHIHYCARPSVKVAEADEIAAANVFLRQVSQATLGQLANPSMPIPFANRALPGGGPKQNFIRGDTL